MLERTQYEQLVYTLPARYSSIRLSTLVLAPPGLDIARLNGLIAFGDDYVLCVYELLNFQQGVIEAYRYEVSRCHPHFTQSPLPEAVEYCRASYSGKGKLYWYDSWPHPNDPTLAATHPHHKHIPPNIKHNRIPTSGLSFTRPNLPFLIEEIEQELLGVRLAPTFRPRIGKNKVRPAVWPGAVLWAPRHIIVLISLNDNCWLGRCKGLTHAANAVHCSTLIACARPPVRSWPGIECQGDHSEQYNEDVVLGFIVRPPPRK